jgi:YD repeat-containing protein
MLSQLSAYGRHVVSALLIAIQIPAPAAANVSLGQTHRLIEPASSDVKAWPSWNTIFTDATRLARRTRSRLSELPEYRRELSKLSRAQFEDALLPTRPTSTAEDRALLVALKTYHQKTVPDDFGALQTFLIAYPHSGWRLALLTNLGYSYYHYGYFSKAISAFENAWKEGQSLTEPGAKALADRAIGELIRMHARIGHADKLEELLDDIKDRPVTGPATEAVDGGKEGLWTMRNNPGIAYLCGPMALRSLFFSKGIPQKKLAYLDAARSGTNGFTLKEVVDLAARSKLPHRAVFRAPDQDVPVPSVVHWKVGHFAAILAQKGGRFHIQDPTFGTDLWVTRDAIDSEASGYFLLAENDSNIAWRAARPDEMSSVRGMGYTQSNDPNATTSHDDNTASDDNSGDTSNQDNNKDDSSTDPPCPNMGMCGSGITEMVVSVRISDTPVGYRPKRGPAAYTSLSYNQREASQPATFGWSNVGPKWSMNWINYIEDDPTLTGGPVVRHEGGGGALAYSTFLSPPGRYAFESQNGAALYPDGPAAYRRLRNEGSVEIFATSDGSTSYPRRIFLTKVTDPAGNALTFHYDDQMRLTSVTDATGRDTTFSYDLEASPLLVTKITDPFGRSALLTYDDSGRLSSITDVIGITSSFSYDSAGLISALQTPYGQTSYRYGDNGNTRFAELTDPLGQTERVEYNQQVPSAIYSEDPSLVPQNHPNPFNQNLDNRDTYIWNKHAFATAPGDYASARVKHWHHMAFNGTSSCGVIESIKNPLENRIWYAYPGQDVTGSASSGFLDLRSYVGRVLDDGTTQGSTYTYSLTGQLIHYNDPLGRRLNLDYDGYDLVGINRPSSPTTFATLATITYNKQHQPLTYKDASGQTTAFDYDAYNQLIRVTDPLKNVTTYNRDSLGRITKIINANNKTAVSLTYDSFDRVASRTDSEGYTVQYSYDALDRLTQKMFPDGTTRKYTWDKLDLVSITDRQGRSTAYTYDSLRRVVDIADPLNRHTKFSYWEDGEVNTLTDPAGNSTNWNIDIQGRVISKVYADGSEITYQYENTTSRLASVTDALQQTKQYTYANDGRISAISYINAVNPTGDVKFAYDPYFPRIVSMTDSNGTRQYHLTYARMLAGSPARRQ